MAICKYRTKRGVRYKATLWRSNIPVCSKSFMKKGDASEWLMREELKIEDNRVGRLHGDSISLSEFYEIYAKSSKVRESTAIVYKRIFKQRLSPAFGLKHINKITVSDWNGFFDVLRERGVSKASINRIHATASAIYKTALKLEYVTSNPLQKVDWELEPLPNRLQYWTYSELKRFLESVVSRNKSKFVFYRFLYETGLRISEIIALRWDSLDFIASRLQVSSSYSRVTRKIEQTTKNGKVRILALNSELLKNLFELRSISTSCFVFCSSNGEQLAYETVRQHMIKDSKTAFVPCIGIHGLRHTFASHFVMNGGSLYDLQKLMGHSDIATTMRYAHLCPEHLASKAALVEFREGQPDSNH